MRFSCLQSHIMGAVSVVSRAMAGKSTLQLLEGIHIRAEGQELILKCMNMTLQIETRIIASVFEEGVIVLPGRLFSEVIRRLPPEELEVEVNESNAATISCGASRTTLQGLDAQEFPAMPSLQESVPITLPQNTLKDMIKKTVFATAHDETKPVLTGSLLQVEDDTMTMVALDGYRLALRKEKLNSRQPEQKVVLPAKSLNEIAKVLQDEGETQFSAMQGYARFEIGDTCVISRLLEGEFIKYKQIIPQEYTTRVHVKSSVLFSSIERASLLAREGQNNLVKLSMSEDGISITSQSEMGNAYENVACDFEGKDLEIAFNAVYLLDVLRVLEEESVVLDFNSSVSPCVAHPLEDERFTYLILPVRIY